MASPQRLSFIELFLHQRGDRGSLSRTGVTQARDDAGDVGDGMILVEFEFHLHRRRAQLEADDASQTRAIRRIGIREGPRRRCSRLEFLGQGDDDVFQLGAFLNEANRAVSTNTP